MKIVSTLAALIALSAAAAAQTEPVPGCRPSNSPLQKLICENAELAELDRDVNSYLAQLRANLPAAEEAKLTQSQAQWLAQRDRACGKLPARVDDDIGRGMLICLRDTSRQRLMQLAAIGNAQRAAGSGLGLSGQYRYADGAGALYAYEWPDGRFTVLIDTVGRVPETHHCSLRFDLPRATPGITASPADYPNCRVEIGFAGRAVTVRSQGCKDFCGQDGRFDGAYRK